MTKRLLDVVLAAAALLLAAPLLVLIAAAIRLRDGPPVLFIQVRPGLNARPFRLYKFRTMRELSDADGSPRADCERLTALGSLLRRTSLDELPELFNVLRGDMSLVGPRPLLMEYLPLYSREEMRRHDVRPGLTGLAQVQGRNALTWEEKFALDLEYVEKRSFWLDLKILLLTVRKVAAREGVSQPGHVTMEKFRGHAE